MDVSTGPPVIYVRDPRTRQFTYVDPACEDQIGFTQAELYRGDVSMTTFTDRTVEQTKAIAMVLITGAAEVVEFTCMMRRKDEGTWRPMHVRAELLVVPGTRPQIMCRVSEVDLALMGTAGPVCETGERELDSLAHVT